MDDAHAFRIIGDWLREKAKIPPHLRGYRILQKLILDILSEPDIIFSKRLDSHCRELDAALGYGKRGAQSAAQRAIYQALPKYCGMGLAQFLAQASEELSPDLHSIPSKERN